jgi:DNA invertase Pin-like site-specific DNA recombinase
MSASAKQVAARIAALGTEATPSAPTFPVAVTNHAPQLRFAAVGPPVYGYLRTDGDEQVRSRMYQSDLIRNYASARGWRKPEIQNDASRETLLRCCPADSILIVPKLASLFQKPSHVSEIVVWALKRNVTIHAVESGGDISTVLPTVRQAAECFDGLEREIVSLRQQLKDQSANFEIELQDFATILLKQWTDKQRGLAQQIETAKDTAWAAVKSGDAERRAKELAERRAYAYKVLTEMGYHGPAPAPSQEPGWEHTFPASPLRVATA